MSHEDFNINNPPEREDLPFIPDDHIIFEKLDFITTNDEGERVEVRNPTWGALIEHLDKDIALTFAKVMLAMALFKQKNLAAAALVLEHTVQGLMSFTVPGLIGMHNYEHEYAETVEAMGGDSLNTAELARGLDELLRNLPPLPSQTAGR